MSDFPEGLTLGTLLDALQTLSPARIFVLGRDGVFLLNHNSPSAVGRSVLEVYATQDHEPIRRALAGEEVRWRAEAHGDTFDLAVRPMRVDGEVTALLGVATRITSQVDAEQQADANAARLKHIVASNMVAMVFWDDDGTITEANAAFLALTGHDREELESGALNASILSPPGSEDADASAREEVARDGVCTPYQKEVLHKSGRLVPALVGGARFDKHSRAGVGFLLDMTERQQRDAERARLQAQLLQVQKLESLGVLAGGIAHDFNNLLTAILGGASTALLALPAESPARVDVENVLAAGRRAASLTRQMLAYSGKGHFQIKPIDLSSLVDEITTLLETTISKKVQLRLELRRPLPPVEADVAQVQQILMNLVMNAAEAIGDQTGTVLVTTGVQRFDHEQTRAMFALEAMEPGQYVFVEVHDTGVGMDEATKEKIFDPFFSTKFTGRGLGLAAVLGILRSHKGAIRVHSTPGRGSTFKVFFPASARAVQPSSLPTRHYSGSGLVLVVDDDAAVRGVTRRILTMLGFCVVEAENGREAVDVYELRRAEVVLVLLDMTMPVMDGEEAFRELRALGGDVPVILMSGYNEIEATRRFAPKGLAGFLQKPFTLTELVARLDVALPASAPAGSPER